MKQKTIQQLIKLGRRAHRRAQASLSMLTRPPRKNPDAKPWKGNPGLNVKFHRARLEVCALVMTALRKDLLARRIGLPGIRDARPLRIQRMAHGL